MGLLKELQKYIKDALPGGSLNPEVTNQGLLDAAAMSTMFAPGVGDVAGLVADANRLYNNPEERTPLNFGLAALGALPMIPGIVQTRKIGAMDFDPRFDPRKKELDKLKSLTTTVDERVPTVPEVSIKDFEGKPVIFTMSDRTGVGELQGINDVMLKNPVDLQGGQKFMYENPGMTWASAKGPVNQIMKKAAQLKKETGQDPLLMPWRMAPTGGDFASMTGETMIAYADAAMGKGVKKELDKSMKALIPDWPGVSSGEKAIEAFRGASDKARKAAKNVLDTTFRDSGGLSIGQTRLSVADPEQLAGRDAGLMHVGRVFADKPVMSQTAHAAYPYGVPGEGIGRLKEDLGVYQMLPEVASFRGVPNPAVPRQTDIRALQMKPYGTVITEGLLRELEKSGALK